jgi:uncharacterized membrane protein YeiH
MTLIENWNTTATKLWSVRLAALTAFLSALQVALPHLITALNGGSATDLLLALLPMLSGVVPTDVLSLLTTVTALATIVARLIVQPSLSATATPKE